MVINPITTHSELLQSDQLQYDTLEYTEKMAYAQNMMDNLVILFLKHGSTEQVLNILSNSVHWRELHWNGTVNHIMKYLKCSMIIRHVNSLMWCIIGYIVIAMGTVDVPALATFNKPDVEKYREIMYLPDESFINKVELNSSLFKSRIYVQNCLFYRTQP